MFGAHPCLTVGGLARSHHTRIPRQPTREELDGAGNRAGDDALHHRFVVSVVHVAPLRGRYGVAVRGRARGARAPRRRAPRVPVALSVLAFVPARPLGCLRIRLFAAARVALCAGCWWKRESTSADTLGAGGDVRTGTRRFPGPATDRRARPGQRDRTGRARLRFIPALYRHFNDTLAGSPCTTRPGARPIAPSETASFRSKLSCLERPGEKAELGRGRGTALGALARAYIELGYSPRDSAFFLLRMLRFATTGERRRSGEYEDLTWWDFCTKRSLDPRKHATAAGAVDARILPIVPRVSPAIARARSSRWTRSTAMRAPRGASISRWRGTNSCPADPSMRARRPDDRSPAHAVEDPPRSAGRDVVSGSAVKRSGSNGAAPPIETEFELAPQDCASFEQRTDYVVIATDLVAAEQLARPIREWGRAHAIDVGVFQNSRLSCSRFRPLPTAALLAAAIRKRRRA